MRRYQTFPPLAWGLGLALAPAVASSAPEEIQVYMDELNARGEPGLDVHLNTVLSGVGGPAVAGGAPSLHRWRITPEWSLGLGSGFEAGLYLPLLTVGPGEPLRADGAKVRLKWLAPHGESGFYLGVNDEVGWSDHQIDDHRWNNEVKLIAGWRRGRGFAAVNANVDFGLSGPHRGPATLELDEKVGWRVSKTLTLGIETYNAAGPIRRLSFGGADQSTFATADVHLGRWDLNLGLGHGYGGNLDGWIGKMIISAPIAAGR